MATDQADGLVADRADRHQDGHVRAILLAALQHERRVALARAALAVGVKHAMEPLRHPADAPGLRGRMQVRGGEEGVHVLQGGGGLVETARRAVELAGRQAGRDGVRAPDDAHAGFVLGVRVSDDGDLAGRNQRDTAFGQRLAQRVNGTSSYCAH